MERLTLRLNAAQKALFQFQEALQLPKNPISRDVSLLRFQFTIEASWKLAQHYLREKEGVDVNSPKGAARSSLQQGLLNKEETSILLEILDNRNLIVHTYNEALAQSLYNKLDSYYIILHSWIQAIEQKLKRF